MISPSLSELREKRRRALHSSPVSPSLKVEREGRADGHYFLQEIFDTLIFLERILSQTLKNKKEEDYYFSTSNRWGFSATDERRRQTAYFLTFPSKMEQQRRQPEVMQQQQQQVQ